MFKLERERERDATVLNRRKNKKVRKHFQPIFFEKLVLFSRLLSTEMKLDASFLGTTAA